MSTLAATSGILVAYTTRLTLRACGLLLSLVVPMLIDCIRGLRMCVLQYPMVGHTGTLSVASQDNKLSSQTNILTTNFKSLKRILPSQNYAQLPYEMRRSYLIS